MKQIELELNKKLLIVELPNKNCEYGGLLKNRNLYFFTEKMSSEEDYPVCYPLPYDCEFICKGLELTEDIAKGFLHQSNHTKLFAHYVKGIPVNTYCYKSYLDSFISAIESKGYHWGENEVKEPIMKDYGYHSSCSAEEQSGWMYEDGEEKYYEDLEKYEKSKSCTFNPEKTIIFEIL